MPLLIFDLKVRTFDICVEAELMWEYSYCFLLLLFSHLAPFFLPSALILLTSLLFFFCFLLLCVFWLLGPLPSVWSSSVSSICPLLLLPPSCPASLSLSLQITVSVAQGRVRSPSPPPRYKSYAYTQAAYVKSPEQKRRRFTDQVRVSLH